MSCENHHLERAELTFDDGDEGRVYYCENCNTTVPSVTTVINRRDDPEKERILGYWRSANDGSDGNADHNHLLKYSGWRGTMFHFNVLSSLEPNLSATDEEHAALRNIKDHSADYNWVYSILLNRAKKRGDVEWFNEHFPIQSEYDGRINPTLRNAFSDDLEWATEAFFNNAHRLGLADVGYDDSDCEDLQAYIDSHVRLDNVREVEQYIPTEYGYSGQYDLVYEKPNGETVLCDLKNSSGIRYSHQMQLAAYDRAIDYPIDRLCVFRAHSDSQEVELRWEHEFEKSRSAFINEFDDLKSKVQRLVTDLTDSNSKSESVHTNHGGIA